MDRRLPCGACGTWACARCGWQRPYARLSYPDHRCGRCGCAEGTLRPTRHGSAIGIFEQHNPRIGPRCRAWAVLHSLARCDHESCWGINHH